jgi:hypothetical protein
MLCSIQTDAYCHIWQENSHKPYHKSIIEHVSCISFSHVFSLPFNEMTGEAYHHR